MPPGDAGAAWMPVARAGARGGAAREPAPPGCRRLSPWPSREPLVARAGREPSPRRTGSRSPPTSSSSSPEAARRAASPESGHRRAPALRPRARRSSWSRRRPTAPRSRSGAACCSTGAGWTWMASARRGRVGSGLVSGAPCAGVRRRPASTPHARACGPAFDAGSRGAAGSRRVAPSSAAPPWRPIRSRPCLLPSPRLRPRR